MNGRAYGRGFCFETHRFQYFNANRLLFILLFTRMRSFRYAKSGQANVFAGMIRMVRSVGAADTGTLTDVTLQIAEKLKQLSAGQLYLTTRKLSLRIQRPICRRSNVSTFEYTATSKES